MGSRFVVCAVALSSILSATTPCFADPCPPPSAGETALRAAAAALAPGETCELAVSLTRVELEAAAGGRPVQWTDSGTWDPIRRRIHWTGRDAGCGNESRPYVHLQYDEDTNTWSLETPPPVDPCGHAYEGNALDPITGTYYFRAYSESIVHVWDGSTWTSTPGIPGSGSSPAIGLTYFPELRVGGATTDGALVWAQTDVLYVLPRGASEWMTIPLPTPIGGYHNVSQHDPVHGVMIFGGGNDATRTVYRMDADGTLTLLGAAPVDLWTHGSEGSYIAVDPVGGEFIVSSWGGGTDGWWTFDAIGDVWTPLVGLPELSGYAFQVPIADYGVVGFFDEVPIVGDEPILYVYRHAPSDLPPLRDGGPSGGADGGSTGADGGATSRDGSTPGLDGGPGTEDGGCSCRVAHRARVPSELLALFVLALGITAWRRAVAWAVGRGAWSCRGSSRCLDTRRRSRCERGRTPGLARRRRSRCE